MSRTFRNKNTVHSGWHVRDNKKPYHVSDGVHPNWDSPPYRRSMYRCEGKWARKVSYRKFRSQVKDRLRNEDWEGLPEFRRTSGWMTW